MSTGGKVRPKSVPDVKFCLVFQCETLSVPAMRRVLGDTLRGVGVDEESVYDILLAATEACTNVLTHGGQVRGYEVVTSLDPAGCQIEVADEGIGMPPPKSRWVPWAGRRPSWARHEQEIPIAQLPESGRGLAVMRACVDQVTLASQPGRGTVVSRNLLAKAYSLPHITAARARGLGELRILMRHVLPVAGPQMIALAGITVSIALGASIPVEALCGLPGIGDLAWQAALSRDLPLLVNLTVLVTLVTLLANTGADVMIYMLRPTDSAPTDFAQRREPA